ncbi:uncharacterized protein LOC127757244 [Oryza glaberrima]|uniref:uncharacterized protein LOC127757244 n=1 Tax=Oryza glaberrima TaxID=4538 RepID=UPI00224BEB2A|nr:uncharacterized protein LOC127757244 [Oryza glaberrima]XP_052138684.1 uncharacterized protein LOC127757244 [Oryza glaberrima]
MVCEKIKDWLLEDATVGAKELQRRIHETHKVKVNYKRVYAGRELALEKLYGKWQDSFDRLYSYKAIIERECPGSFVVIDHQTVVGKLRFRRLFFALKPCIDGFLDGCRPYVAIDSTFLTGKFKGQLATACAVDGHNWMYPVAFGVMDSETNDNWKWFMERLRDAIGNPDGLAVCTDAGKGVDTAVHQVFPYAEHRECMLHLVNNFKKKFHGKVFDDNLWPAAYSYNPYFFQKHIERMGEAKPEVVAYLKQNHVRLWTRSQFSGQCKVDYVTNNLAECFNNWIKEHKGLHLVDFMDKIRHKLMVKWNKRRSISKKLEGNILPHIMKELNEKSRGLNHEVTRSDDTLAEVECKGGSGHRFVVNLRDHTCSCREWQVSGKPCTHAIAFITSIRGCNIEDFVDKCYSVRRFQLAYSKVIPPLIDKSQWPNPTHEFLHPPVLKKIAGRPKRTRYKGCSEKGNTGANKGKHKCPLCKGYGHHWHSCREGDPADYQAMLAERGPPKKRQKKVTSVHCESSIVPVPSESSAQNSCLAPTMSYPPTKSCQSGKKGQDLTITSSDSIRSRSMTGSNQPEPLSVLMPLPPPNKGKAKAKSKAKTKAKVANKNNKENSSATTPLAQIKRKDKDAHVSLDSPAMGTRSKKKKSLDFNSD